jgi:hypothetical protein
MKLAREADLTVADDATVILHGELSGRVRKNARTPWGGVFDPDGVPGVRLA